MAINCWNCGHECDPDVGLLLFALPVNVNDAPPYSVGVCIVPWDAAMAEQENIVPTCGRTCAVIQLYNWLRERSFQNFSAEAPRRMAATGR
jgi:endogenous inhibitor of DNA gyrase (YacG/DUF329 family)